MSRTPRCEVYIDGASRGNPGPAGVGVVFLADDGSVLHQLSKPVGHTTNNVAEYLALVYALQTALQRGCRQVMVKTDSELLARQISGRYRVRDAELIRLHGLAMHLGEGFERWQVTHVPRAQNAQADRLAGRAADGRPSPPTA